MFNDYLLSKLADGRVRDNLVEAHRLALARPTRGSIAPGEVERRGLSTREGDGFPEKAGAVR